MFKLMQTSLELLIVKSCIDSDDGIAAVILNRNHYNWTGLEKTQSRSLL